MESDTFQINPYQEEEYIMIKRWGLFIILGSLVGIVYIAFNNYRTLWDMVVNIPYELAISYFLEGLTMYLVIFGKKLRKKKNKKVKEESGS